MQRKLFTKLFQKSNLVFGLILFLVLIVRGLFIDRFPSGVNHDEAEVLLSAVSYVESGTDLSGSSFPYSLYSTDTEAGLSGLPSVLLSAVFSFIPLTELNARIVYFALSFFTAVALYYLIKVLGGTVNLARISMLVFLISPWMIFYSRALTEAPFALFFTTLSLLSFFSKNKKSGVMFFIFAISAYLSYQGAKPLVALLSIVLAIAGIWLKLGRAKIYYSIAVFVFSVAFVVVSVMDKNSTIAKRSSEVSFLNPSAFSESVNDSRLRSINTPLTPILENKYVYMIENSVKVYLGFFSPEVLFWSGDPAATYRFGNWGLLYILDLLFVLIAIFVAGNSRFKHRNIFYISIALLLLGVSGSVFSGVRTSYIFRSFMAPLGVAMFVSLGIYALSNLKGLLKNFLLFSTFCLYAFFYLFFMHRFLTTYPVMQQENQFYSEKVLSEFLFGQPSQTKIVVEGVSPTQLSNMYLFYSGERDFSKVKKTEAGILIGNIIFSSSCGKVDSDLKISRVSVCGKSDEQSLVIQDFKDAGYIFEIDGINYCSDYVKSDSYRQLHRFSDYSFIGASNEDFCKRNLFIEI